jgi:hypothetical protein
MLVGGLADASLPSVDLTGALFVETDLTGADLSTANLHEVQMPVPDDPRIQVKPCNLQARDWHFDLSTPTVLRVLAHLITRTDRPRRTEVIDAVMEYVPGAVAVGYLANPDFEIPLPGPDFADPIGVILAAASALQHHTGAGRPQRQPCTPLKL